ncbi:MAG: hypothetical protein ABSH48_22115 [Verrucomicrobiota bacterium]|jgi:hypothetical protein
MRQTLLPDAEVAETQEWVDADRDDAKEVAFPDDETGEIFLRIQTNRAFQTAGYRVLRAEKMEFHPVFVVHLKRTTAEHIGDQARLFRHVRQILNDSRIKLRKAHLMVCRTGDRILVTFLMELPATGIYEQKRRR